jgi:hypothetical protein
MVPNPNSHRASNAPLAIHMGDSYRPHFTGLPTRPEAANQIERIHHVPRGIQTWVGPKRPPTAEKVVIESVTMSEQLSRDSVKMYRFAPQGFETVRRRLTLVQTITFVGVLAIFIATDFKSTDREWLQGSILSLLPHVLALTFIGALFFFSFRRGIRKQRENWLAYELLVGDDFVIRRMPGLSEREVRREEITAIGQSPQGLTIETSSRQRSLAVPATLGEFDEVRARLSEWKAPTEMRRAGWKQSPNLLYAVIIAELSLFIVFFLSTQSWLLVCSGTPLFGGLIWSFVLLQKSAELAPKMKRTMWIILLPLIAIGFRLVEAVRNWR